MESEFIYDRPVSGKYFLENKQELDILRNIIFGGGSVALYDEPKTGKSSLILEMFARARIKGESFITAEIDLTKARTLEDITVTFAGGLVKSCANSPSACKELIQNLLDGTHFIFDEARFASAGEVVSTNWMLDEIDVQKALDLPSKLAAMKNCRIITVVRQFQNIMFAKEGEKILKSLEKIIERNDSLSPFIFTGTRLNAMKDIFEVKRFFWHAVTIVNAGKINPQAISDYIYRGFQSQGKVIDRELIASAANLLRCNMWYLNQLFSIVDHMAHGYIINKNLDDGLNNLISLHSDKFLATIYSLTDFQLNLLKAIINGETRFSASGVIDKYGLNSSANVKRLKDALIKKETVWFDEYDTPHIQDPLFEYWLRKIYFAV